MSSLSRQEVVTQSTKGGCRHQVDRRSSHSRPKGLPSPSRQKGNVVTKSTRGRYTADRRGCRHPVDKKGMSSPSRQEVVTQLTEGGGTPSQPKEVGDTKSTQGSRGHQVNPRSGDTKLTQGAGTPSQPKEVGDTKSTEEWGHQVNPMLVDNFRCFWRRRRFGNDKRTK
ncbi:hypothetical protein BDD12DRAFT_809902 [Trichophaea hybrida]|nr:hypothetical protein BDD12DRAFT_809902 [Trichophaea hybrida]